MAETEVVSSATAVLHGKEFTQIMPQKDTIPWESYQSWVLHLPYYKYEYGISLTLFQVSCTELIPE
jgi:hypothetical protein